MSTSPPSAPRALRADAARNRIAILVAAREAFAEAGTEAHAEEVARRAGVGVGTLYRHFPTKEALAEAVLDLKLSEIEAWMREECFPEPDPWRALELMFRHAGETQAADRHLAGAIRDVLGPDPESRAHRERLEPLAAEVVRRGQDAGVVRPDVGADDLSGLFCGLGAVAASDGDWERYVDIVLAGLRAPGPAS